MEIYDKQSDRHEERRTDEKKTEARRNLEKKMQTEPMKTFEAKLAEKAAHEITSKESIQRQTMDQKQTKEEKQSLMDKILGVAGEKAQEEKKARVGAVHREGERHFEEEKSKRHADADFDVHKTKEEGDPGRTQKKGGEHSAEGHKRVAEKEDDQSSGGSGGSGREGFADAEQSGQQSSSSNSRQDARAFKQKIVQHERDRLSAILKSRGFGSGGFTSDARDFTSHDLDEIVSAVELGVNEHGEQEFSVQLTDDYFDGLKLQATRTDAGVVIKFVCSNVGVRSTFLKFRPKIYRHFKAKGISVQRIDVV